MKISIIIPVYNVEKYVSKCIDSILNQTFKDFEIILVDDGSKDNSGAICDEYGKKDKRIKVVHQKNQGLSAARNTGIEIAEGEYINFTDSDDWMDSKALENFYNAAVKYNADIVQGSFVKTSDDDFEAEETENKKIQVIDNIQGLSNLYNDKYIETVVAWGKLYRKEIFNQIRFPAGKIHEDEYVIHQTLYTAQKIVLLNKIVYYYRQVQGSIINSGFNIKKASGYIEAMENRFEFLTGTKDTRLKNVINLTLKRDELKTKSFYNYSNSDEIESHKEIGRLIKKHYRKMFPHYIASDEISFAAKVKGFIFYVNPYIYKKIYTIKKKL